VFFFCSSYDFCFMWMLGLSLVLLLLFFVTYLCGCVYIKLFNELIFVVVLFSLPLNPIVNIDCFFGVSFWFEFHCVYTNFCLLFILLYNVLSLSPLYILLYFSILFWSIVFSPGVWFVDLLLSYALYCVLFLCVVYLYYSNINIIKSFVYSSCFTVFPLIC